MKKLIIIGSAIIAFASCDKVKNPNQNPNANSNCVVTPHIVKTNSLTSGYRKVLVEDYTGHTCGNCPKAARAIENLEKTASFKDSMVVMAVHGGNTFAKPDAPNGFPEEFRNDASNDWDYVLGMSVAGFPKISVNRTQGPATWPQSYTSLNTLIPASLHKPQTAKIGITTYLDTTKLLLNVAITTTFTAVSAVNVKLCLVLTEDSIIAPQVDYVPPAGTITEPGFPDHTLYYVFNNMNRGAINGSWGDLVKSAPIAIGDTVSNNFTCFKVTPYNNVKKNLKNISLVAFLYYDDLSKEILQAEKLKIK